MVADLRVFPPFRLDSNEQRLWRGTEEIRLRAKTFAVLRYLVEHPGQLVTKAALLDAVWADVSVSDTMPAISVRELRKTLGDEARTPRFIETVHRRGYRFIAAVKSEPNRGSTRTAPPEISSAVPSQQGSFVGREHERSELRAGLADATSGRGRLFLISGEPGIGKTRLCAELALEAHANGMAVLAGHCSEQEAVAYLPFVEILECCVDRAQSPDDVRSAMGEEGVELGRLLPKLRRILPDLPPPPELPDEQARRQLFNSFCNFIARRSREQPTLLILEDLHWADESTLALISHFSQRHSDLPLMVICTYRASEIDLSPGLARTLEDLIRSRLATQIRLEGLPRDEVALMLKSLSGQAPPAAVAGEIHAETEGNPFFVEELFRHLAEEHRLYDPAGQFRAELKIGELEAPHNVKLVVGRRLARLGEAANKILAVAAVIGRSFTVELLEASTPAKTDSMLDDLDEVAKVGLIRSTTEYPKAPFEFSHELIRQVILSQLSAARRQRLHLDVADAIERSYADTLEDHYATLAHHYARTHDARKAVKYLHLAGKQAMQRSAHAEAIRMLNSGLELLKSLPDTLERDRQELALQTAIGPSLMETRGDASPEVEASYGRALELSRRVGDTPELFNAQGGLVLFYMNRGEHQTAHGLAKNMLSLAQSANDPAQLLLAHGFMGTTSHWLAEFALAHAHFEQTIAYYDSDSQRHRNLAFLYGMDLGAGCLGYAAWPLWYMGYPDQALKRTLRALAVARELGHPSTMAMTFNHAASGYNLRRDAIVAQELAEAGIALANEHGFELWIALCTLQLGHALTESGQAARGIILLQEGLKASLATGARVPTSWLVEAYWKTGQSGKGLSVIAETLATVHEPGKLVGEPELHRLKGELLLMEDSSSATEAEGCFRTAIEISRRQAAKSLELRATMSLARLLAKQGKRDEARAALAEIYGWFTEGFDTADLKDAKALLDELGG